MSSGDFIQSVRALSRERKVSEVRHKNVAKCERSRLHVNPPRPQSSCFHNMQYYQEAWHCGQKRKLDRSQQREIASAAERASQSAVNRFPSTFRGNMGHFNKHCARRSVCARRIRSRDTQKQDLFCRITLKKKILHSASRLQNNVPKHRLE